jgi:hypothetical protein
MCLVTKQKVAKIAKEDITCYKILGANLRTPYMGYTYNVGKLYKVKLSVRWTNNWCSFDAKTDKAYLRKSGGDMVVNEIEKGFHAALKVDRLKDVWGVKRYGVFEFLIPTGSEYFRDKTGLIVSNRIMLVNDINLLK